MALSNTSFGSDNLDLHFNCTGSGTLASYRQLNGRDAIFAATLLGPINKDPGSSACIRGFEYFIRPQCRNSPSKSSSCSRRVFQRPLNCFIHARLLIESASRGRGPVGRGRTRSWRHRHRNNAYRDSVHFLPLHPVLQEIRQANDRDSLVLAKPQQGFVIRHDAIRSGRYRAVWDGVTR